MKIKKKSWHYRLNKEFSSAFVPMPQDLCGYMLLTVKSIFFVILIAFVSWMVFLGIGYMFWSNIIGDSVDTYHIVLYTILGIPTLFGITFFLVKMTDFMDKANDKLKQRSRTKEPSFIKRYINNRKNVCEIIEYED